MNSVYSQKDAYELYVYYLALKRHFTSNYDFFKYNGKINASLESFEKRKDKYQFYKLSKKKNAKSLILSNMIVDSSVWIGYLNEPDAEEVYKEWAKRIDGLTYAFKNDLNQLNENFDSNIIVKDKHTHPKLLRLYMTNDISLETLVILNDLTKCFLYWKMKLDDTIILPHINKLVEDYTPFLNYDRGKMKDVVVNQFKHTN